MRPRTFVLVSLLVALPGPALAAGFTVANGDVVGLIAAITMANATPGSDVIDLARGGRYVLTAPFDPGAPAGPSGLPPITSFISINGNDSVIIRNTATSTSSFRLVHVHAAGTLSLRQITLAGGAVPSFQGGAILNHGLLRIDEAQILTSTASTGGGIANRGTTSLEDVVLRMNRATVSGGAIWNQGRVVLARTSVLNNFAGRGGGLFLVPTTVPGVSDLTASLVQDNQANEGGGIWSSTDLDLVGTTVHENESALSGGGVYMSAGLLNITDSTISSNRANGGLGGGIRSRTGVRLWRSTLHSNYARDGGGAIAHQPTSRATPATTRLAMNNTTISGNFIDSADGGALLVRGLAEAPTLAYLIMTNSTITLNRATGGFVRVGGVQISDAASVLGNVIVSGNTGTNFSGRGSSLTANGLIGGDAGLGPLAANGGPTLTHKPLPGSLAIDTGLESRAVDGNRSDFTGFGGDPIHLVPLTIDQRRRPRFVRTVDLGAVEVE